MKGLFKSIHTARIQNSSGWAISDHENDLDLKLEHAQLQVFSHIFTIFSQFKPISQKSTSSFWSFGSPFLSENKGQLRMCGAGTAGGPVLEQLESQCLLYSCVARLCLPQTVPKSPLEPCLKHVLRNLQCSEP